MHEKKTLIEDLIEAFTCLPGVGKKTAQRMTYYLLQRAKEDALNLSDVLKEVVTNTINCKACRNLSQNELCELCSDLGRTDEMLCVVESPADVFNMENSTNYNGRYFVLLGRLSPLEGIGPQEIGIESLDKIMSSGNIKEIILALNYTVESDVTAHVISELAIKNSIKITRLAQGVPVGGELEYLDQHTLSKAFDKRTIY
ncbi:MAG: recombination protein RecR [Gammaproteobacteria bacterium]|jgi:recombination protein RecR|nr:recombination protein RecR [Gammaproteobacteria bacterium]MBT6755535.1 recombination protein RecR [Gammaproteobacteria bacterium]MBT7523481.1 recombination protein RecR [Gammaproteobacteria bacterium]MBT7814737.1 recombination protein RecR [Gammaproteobacteria bacterium]MDC3386680.1 recombination mediator RecR [Gammaproteobacteria bacterium]|tara:strand:- start:1742 stop:2341 length:600 start_codon:yes stop_codon:yes gene_type:complete